MNYIIGFFQKNNRVRGDRSTFSEITLNILETAARVLQSHRRSGNRKEKTKPGKRLLKAVVSVLLNVDRVVFRSRPLQLWRTRKDSALLPCHASGSLRRQPANMRSRSLPAPHPVPLRPAPDSSARGRLAGSVESACHGSFAPCNERNVDDRSALLCTHDGKHLLNQRNGAEETGAVHLR